VAVPALAVMVVYSVDPVRAGVACQSVKEKVGEPLTGKLGESKVWVGSGPDTLIAASAGQAIDRISKAARNRSTI
jgi:hypothetical protein